MSEPSLSSPGWVCPFCGADCSPIAPTPACAHFFLADGENGWRFTDRAAPLADAASVRDPTLFRELLYHDRECRRHLRLRRAVYDGSLEMYVFSGAPDDTVAAFRGAIGAAGEA
jgi:hypothetical protein